MMKTSITYLLILIGAVLLYCSTSVSIMGKISSIRNESDAWWGVHNSEDKGDLVNLAYLDNVTKFHSERDYAFSRPNYYESKNVNLYMEGDSYTFKIPDSAFLGLNRYEYIWVGHDIIHYNLDTTKKNILIVERAERYVMNYFSRLDLLWNVQGKTVPAAYYESRNDAKSSTSAEALSWLIPSRIDGFFRKLFNGNINQNLEYNIFNYNLLNAPRLAKAALNYKVFNRASGNVTIADNGEQLYIKETTEMSGQGSSFSKINDDEYELVKNNMNLLYEYYKAEGFDEIYIAVVPNPVSILEPDYYNGLIPQLQNDKSVKIKFINVYDKYTTTNETVYRSGDTHWNNVGMQIWIDLVNRELRKWNEMP